MLYHHGKMHKLHEESSTKKLMTLTPVISETSECDDMHTNPRYKYDTHICICSICVKVINGIKMCCVKFLCSSFAHTTDCLWNFAKSIK